jgi:hypothetical protein
MVELIINLRWRVWVQWLPLVPVERKLGIDNSFAKMLKIVEIIIIKNKSEHDKKEHAWHIYVCDYVI